MNLILSFLDENFANLQLERHGTQGAFSALMLTPNIYRSNHVEFLIMTENNPEPIFVAKIPRTPESFTFLQQEYENLSRLQTRNSAYTPQLQEIVAYETYQEVPILIQRPISGTAIGPRTDKAALRSCWQQMTKWQIELQQFPQIQRSATLPETARSGWFQRLIEYPIRYFTKFFPITEREVRLLVRTWDLVQPLSNSPIPLVFEHHNLAKYNVKLKLDGQIAVINWDLANPYGLPACDLFRLLGTSAISVDGATSRSSVISAIQHAFFEREPWALPYVHEYAHALQLSRQMLTALFAMTWLQALVNLMIRMGHTPVAIDKFAQIEGNECSAETAQWLRKRHSYLLWEYTIEHAPLLFS